MCPRRYACAPVAASSGICSQVCTSPPPAAIRERLGAGSDRGRSPPAGPAPGIRGLSWFAASPDVCEWYARIWPAPASGGGAARIWPGQAGGRARIRGLAARGRARRARPRCARSARWPPWRRRPPALPGAGPARRPARLPGRTAAAPADNRRGGGSGCSRSARPRLRPAIPLLMAGLTEAAPSLTTKVFRTGRLHMHRMSHSHVQTGFGAGHALCTCAGAAGRRLCSPARRPCTAVMHGRHARSRDAPGPRRPQPSGRPG
jgi:hypothetical protein